MIDALKPYPEYKDSGLPWLGGIPRHWDIGPGLAAFREKSVKNIGLQEKTVLSLSYGRIVIKPLEKLHGLVPESFETYQIVDPGEIIIRSTDLQNDWKSLRVGFVRDRGIITSAYLCFKTLGKMSPEYGYLLLHAFDLMKVFYGMGSGLRQNLDFSDFKRMRIFVPPSDEQVAIVRFLNHTDRRINHLIRNKLQLIKLLNEQKQAIIQRAVTRGLDPNVRLKPSGIAWLGSVPEHWAVKRVQSVFIERKERGRDGLPVLLVSLNTGVTETNDVDEDGRPRRLIDDRSAYKLTMQGDIAYNMMRMWQGAVGAVPVDGLVSPAYVVAKPLKGMNSRYFSFVFRTDACKGEINCCSRGIVSDRNRLYWDDFKAISLPVPDPLEQKQIVEFIDKETQRIEDAISSARREIDLLREYRIRLIADVVTGKVDVREAAATLPDEVEESEIIDDSDVLAEDALEEDLEAVPEEAEA